MGKGNKKRKAFAALTLSLCLLLSGCAQPPKPVTEAETQTILYTAAGHETGQFSSSCGITPVGDMLLFDRRARNDNGDVTRVSYYCKDLKTGEETAKNKKAEKIRKKFKKSVDISAVSRYNN